MKSYTIITATILCSFLLKTTEPLEARNASISSSAIDGMAQMDSAKSEAPAREKFDPTRDPAKDIANAVIIAQKDGRRILLDVGGEWCSWCHKLDKFFQDYPDVGQFLNQHYVVVKVNYSKENKNEKVLFVYPPINGYPHLFVLEPAGTFLHSQDTGELESGKNYDHDKVLTFLKNWALRPKS